MKENYCICCGRIITHKSSTKYCKKHLHQIDKYGKTLDNNPRSKFDPNEFRFIGDNTVEMDTYKLPSCEVDKTYLFDVEDYPLISKYKWSSDIGGYARSGANSLKMHRLITNAKVGQQVDHINLNILDNRKNNLRICTNSLNASNRKPYNKLNIKGIEYHKKINKYSAYFRIDNKQYHSPCYNTQEEAAFARFILEQTFCKEYLVQFSSELINTLDIEIKENIILGIKSKFNIE